MISKKKKKKGHRADGGIFFSDFMLISKKKKVLRLSSASFLRDLCDIPERGAVNRSCLRFLATEKMPEFTKFQCENAGKNFALFCTYREHCPRPCVKSQSLVTHKCHAKIYNPSNKQTKIKTKIQRTSYTSTFLLFWYETTRNYCHKLPSTFSQIMLRLGHPQTLSHNGCIQTNH